VEDDVGTEVDTPPDDVEPPSDTTPPGPDAGMPPEVPPPPVEADAGTPDTGTPDAGTQVPPPPVEADAGTPDAGSPETGSVVYPDAHGWTFYGQEQGAPREVYGVTEDEGGNVWVAGGEDGLFLLKPGATTLQRFTLADGLHPYGYMPDGSDAPGEKYLKVISVAGGPAGTVFVGYEGKPGKGSDHCESNWDRHDGIAPDPSRYKSGDADKVTLRADDTLQVVHYDIFSGPTVVRDEQRGREKLCNILRIAYDKNTQSVWFGGNHGFARGDARFTGNNTCNGQLSCAGVLEHVHPHINAIGPDGNSILLTDAYYGMAVHSSGDVFVGGANRATRFRYGSNGNNYWSAQSMTEDKPYPWNRFDIWPDKVGEPNMPRPSDRVDDNVSGMAVSGDNTVWVSSFSQGLARMDAEGGDVHYVGLPDKHLAGLAVDPSDGSVWTGAYWLGLVFRVKDGNVITYGCSTFGNRLCGSRVYDIQVDRSNGGRRILVGFYGNDDTHVPGAIGIYSGN
jgi:hypothetical protein